MYNHHFDAVIFDLDGVITDTASIHSTAWKQMFDEFLKANADEINLPFREFTHEGDYLPFVDGKPRYQGVSSFLASRGIDLPFGNTEDSPDELTICGLGNRKNEIFNRSIISGNINVYQSTVNFIHQLHTKGIRVGVASSSKNARAVLEAVGLLDLIETLVDGVVSANAELKGKPEPDIFTTACDNLGVFYDRAVIVEDAISGVQAGQNGGFGLVIGIARENNSLELKLNGADIVVEDMAEVDIHKIENWLTKRLAEEVWSISFFDYDHDREGMRETLLSVGNGYFGTRGAQEETTAKEINYPGTYIAGLYNRLESEVGGRNVNNEDFVNCPNWLPITFKIAEGNWFNPNQSEIRNITRRLDFRTGILHRSMIISDEQGRETRIDTQRFASMADPHVAAVRYQLLPLNYDERITIKSTLDGTVVNTGVARYRQLSLEHLLPVTQGAKGNRKFLLVKTNQSNTLIAEAARLIVAIDGQEIKPDFENNCAPGIATVDFCINAQRGEALTVDKLVAIYSSNQHQVDDPLEAAQKALSDQYDYDHIQQTSAAAWEDIWNKVDIQIEGDRVAQKLIRMHIYHTVITASPHNKDLDAGLPARGLHGEAYRGHIFWDEIYSMPFYNLQFPEIARSALMYRYRRLGQAQKYAHVYGYQGAMFPWQSGSDGREETQTLHLNPLSGEWGPDYSSLQRHVSLAIAYNIWKYIWITEDQDFLENYGVEMFLEICRFWACKASLNPTNGRYEITQVMGPDEFHEKYSNANEGGLKNNSYTNILVAWCFQRAFDLLDKMSVKSKKAIIEKIGLTDDEQSLWEEISKKLFIPISSEGIIEQFEGYFELEELDWTQYRDKYGNIQRIDRILKAEGKKPDNFKVAKQADVLMTFYLLDEVNVKSILQDLGYKPPDNLLHENFYYYLNRTTHGSTLSRLVHAYLAHILGDNRLSWKLYTEALKSDYVDIQGGTTREGIHAGVMAGTINFALHAYAGVKFDGQILAVDPNLPATWRKMSFSLIFKGSRYYFSITPDFVEVKTDGNSVNNVMILGEEVSIQPNRSVKKKLIENLKAN